MRSETPPAPGPAREPGVVAAQLIAALADGRRAPGAVLDEHSRLTGWGASELDELMRAFDAAEATERLPDTVIATVRAALLRWSRDARNGATDQMPALVDAGDWTEEMGPPDAGEDTSEIAAAAVVVPAAAPTAAAPAPASLAPPTLLFIEPGAVLLGRYEVLRPLGRGGTAFVHLARDRRRDCDDGREAFVAIKSPKPGSSDPARAVARLKREFRQTRTLSHPHIVRMHDLDRDGEHWFITMEWLDGESLVETIQREAPLPGARALAIVRACAEALAFAHGRGIVHGDFKPSNVMIDAHDDVRLLDFGAAPDSSGGEEAGAGEDLRCFATRCYASPETLAGEPPTPRDDVFSLACVVYELLSGEHPFQRRGADEARAAGATVTPLANLAPGQNAVLARGLAWQRTDRPFGALEFLDALEAAAAPGASAPATPALDLATIEASRSDTGPVVAPQERSAPAVESMPPEAAAALAVMPIPAALAPPAATATRLARTVRRTLAALRATRSGARFPTVTVVVATVLAFGFLLFLPLREPPTPSQLQPSPQVTTPIAPTGLPPLPVAAREVAALSASSKPTTGDDPSRRPTTRIGFDAAEITVDESAFAAVLTLRRSGDTRAGAPVNWRVAGGSARAGEDFSGPTSGTARFAAGQTLRTLYVPLINDGDAEGPEAFSVQLRATGRNGLGPVDRATVTIVDDD